MKVSSNKALDVYQYYRDQLVELYGPEESASLMAILFDHFLSLKRHEILSGAARRISESELLKIHFAHKELLKQRPIQYIIGTAWFYGAPFYVTPQVLIPRQETEELCDWIIKDCASNVPGKSSLKVIDIGTGSGCIAITLKKQIANAEVTALDLSEGALQIARTNADALDAALTFIQGDVLQKDQWPQLPYDIIVSNPPYVRESEKSWMKPNVVDHEPHLALFVKDEDPLLFYDAIARFALQTLTEKGRLYFEINEYLQDDLNALLSGLGYTDIEFRKDLNNKPRMIRCSLGQHS